MTAPARFTQADINRAMKAARLAGYAKRRDQGKLARSAMAKWGRTDSETANELENIPER